MMNLLQNVWDRRSYLYYAIRGQLSGAMSIQALGYIWWIIEPLALTAIYTFVVTVVFKSGGPNLPLTILVGVMAYRWTRSSVAESVGSIRNQAGLIQAGYMPKLLFPLVSLGVSGFRFLVAIMTVIIPALLYMQRPLWTLLLLPIVILLHGALNLGLCLLFSHFGTYFPDTKYVWDLASRFWMYLSPIWYVIPKGNTLLSKLLYGVNPMVGLVQSYRWIVMGTEPPTLGQLVPILVGIVVTCWVGLILHSKHDLQYAKVMS